MKKCKYCQSEIDEKAKICPSCHKKQSHLVRWIVLGFIVLVIVVAAMGGKDKEDFQKEYKQDEVVTYKDVKYSITKVEKTQGSSEWVKPKDGYEYVKVTVKIENNSDKKISYNALDWHMVNADGQEDTWGAFTADDDITLSSGDLNAGGKVEGVLVWEQKKGDSGLKVRYYENALFDKDYTFEWTLN